MHAEVRRARPVRPGRNPLSRCFGGLDMVLAAVGGSLVVGVVLGWFGYKVNLRIARWGEALTELDREAQLEFAGLMDGYGEPTAPVVSGAVASRELVEPIALAH